MTFYMVAHKLKFLVILFLFLCLPFSLLTSCGQISLRNHRPMIFAVNLSSVKTTIELREGTKPLLLINDLNAFETRPLLSIPDSKTAVLLSKTEITNYIAWKDPSGEPYQLQLEYGKIYAIIIDPMGKATLASTSQMYDLDPKVTLLNATSETLAQVQVAPDFNKNVKIYTQDLAPNQPTDFNSVKPKLLAFFWQTSGQIFSGAYFRMENSTGETTQQNLLTGHYYLFVAANGMPGATVHGRLWDITPKGE